MSNTVQNGKGSRPRPVAPKAWARNYQAIRWRSKDPVRSMIPDAQKQLDQISRYSPVLSRLGIQLGMNGDVLIPRKGGK